MCSTLWFPSVTNTSIYISFIFLLFVFSLKIRCCFCSYRNFLQMYLRKYIHLSEQTENPNRGQFNMHLFPPQSLYTLGSPHFFLGIQMMFKKRMLSLSHVLCLNVLLCHSLTHVSHRLKPLCVVWFWSPSAVIWGKTGNSLHSSIPLARCT